MGVGVDGDDHQEHDGGPLKTDELKQAGGESEGEEGEANASSWVRISLTGDDVLRLARVAAKSTKLRRKN